MKKISDFYSNTFLLFTGLMLSLMSCEKDVVTPVVSTMELTNITYSTAVCNANVTMDGGGSINAKGVCWSTSEEPTISDNTSYSAYSNQGVGEFTGFISGLTPDTKYYARAFAKNSAGIGYGEVLSFTPTKHVPILTTLPIEVNQYFAAHTGGDIYSDGGEPITEKGICWGSNPEPTISNNKEVNIREEDEFDCRILDHSFNTKIYVRAYATSSLGTGYGDEQSFTIWLGAPGPAVYDADSNKYNTVKIGSQVWMQENLKTTHYQNGDLIPTTSSASLDISTENEAKYQWIFADKQSNLDVYGRLYTWYAATDSRNIAPKGMHVPSHDEWDILIQFLGEWSISGARMKETGTTYWDWPNSAATNISGFAGRPGGMRDSDGSFVDHNQYAYWWSTEQYNNDDIHNARGKYLFYSNSSAGGYHYPKNAGLSIRCVMD